MSRRAVSRYARVYSRRDVLRHICALECPSSEANQQSRLEQYLELGEYDAPTWRLVRVPLSALETIVPAGDSIAQGYAERRRGGAAFPAIVLTEYKPGGAPIYPDDGHHRVRAAKIAGDKTIDAFVPARDAASLARRRR